MIPEESNPTHCRAHLCLLIATLSTTPLTAQAIQVHELWSTTGMRNSPFGYISGMAELASGAIVVADNVTKLLFSIDPTGQSVRIISRTGDGPGEVRSPAIMASRPNGGVAVYDLGQGAINFMFADGKFDRRMILPQLVVNPKGFVVAEGDQIFLSGGVTSSDILTLHHYDSTGSLVRAWHPAPPAPSRMIRASIGGGPLALTWAGDLLFSQAAPYAITAYRLDATPRFSVGDSILNNPGETFLKPSTARPGWVTPNFSFPQSRAIFELADRRILNVVWFLEDDYGFWDLYEPDGTFILRQRIETPYEPWAQTRNGDILASRRIPDTGEHVAVRLSVTVSAR